MSKLLAGRYELIERIGEGGMAVVYKARCKLLNRYVAVKILRPEYVKDKQFVENFRKESQAAASLQHPNIISIYDVGKEGDINYIVMELIDGEPLSDIIDEKAPLDYRVAIDYARQIASALNFAHSHGLIHRDIKPHNVMITKTGVAKLGDFGIAKAVSNATVVAETTKVMGSVHYFSPEQARGGKVDERTDIYSLGIVLYEMLTGDVPFDGDNPVQVALMHINDEMTPPSQVVKGIPPALEKIVMKATNKYQASRYNSMAELIEDLDNIEFVTKMLASDRGAKETGKENLSSKKLNDLTKGKKPIKKKSRSKSSGSKNGENKDNKGKKIIISVVVIVIAAALGYFAYSTYFGSGKDKVVVPDVLEMSYSEAKTTLEKEGLKIKKGDEVPNSEIKKGDIVSQYPKSGNKVKKGTVVTVNISIGEKKGLVPSLLNKKYTSREEIESFLEKYGYKLGTVEEKESDTEKGVIISQSQAAGTSLAKGKAIDITVSKGKKEVKVPSVVGMTLDEAKSAITSAGFTVGNISYDDSKVYKGGFVMSQSPDGDTKVKKQGSIDIVVAKMQETVKKEDIDNKENQGNQGNNSKDDEKSQGQNGADNVDNKGNSTESKEAQ